MKKVDPPALKKNIRLVWRMLGISWHVRPLAVCEFFFGAILEIGGFVLSVYATARLGALLVGFVSTGITEGIWFWLAVDIAAAVVSTIGLFIMSYARRLLYFAFVSWTTTAFQEALCRIDLQSYYEEDLRNQINKVASGYTWQVPNLAETNLQLFYGIMRFIIITTLVAQITWWLVPMIAVFLLPTLLAEGKMAKIQWFVWDERGDQRHIFWGLDSILRLAKGQMELRSSQATDYVLERVRSLNRDFYSLQQARFLRVNRLLAPAQLLGVAGTGIGSVVLLRQLLSQSLSLDRYFFLSGALLRITGSLSSIFGTLSLMQEGLLFTDSYFNILDLEPKLIDRASPRSLPSNVAPRIIFDNVSFAYPDQEDAVFTNLDLVIEPGEHVALVGENGAGKSTLIKLLLRLYVPTGGRILVGGVDLQDLAIESWYSLLATLFQDFNQYPLPIDENIYIGRSNQKLDEARLIEAAQFGGVDKMVAGYKHGWETVLDSSFKKGVEPSGGQWQRVALARAFYRQAEVLILDEPTAAIDAKAEYDIFNNIFEHYKDKTTIIVSHRFSTVRRASRIIVMDRGRIVESGSHRALMANQGLYHELFTKQAEGYL